MDYTNGGEEVICDQQNVVLVNNDSTFLSVSKAIVFDKVEILTEDLPAAVVNDPYDYQLAADGGTNPYSWSIKIDYDEEDLSGTFPVVSGQQLIPTNDDDGYVTQELDFSFPYYGQGFDQITILTDGAIVFEEDFKYIRTEESIISNKCITAYCADLQIYPEVDDGIWYEGDENSAIIKWQTGKFGEPWVFVEMAIKLFPDGGIEYYFGSDITEGLNWASGVSNGDGGSYTIAQLSNAYTIPDNYSTQFTAPDYPQGMQISSDGIFSGTPNTANSSWDITFVATDFSNIFSTKTLTFTTIMTDVSNSNFDDQLAFNCFPNPFSGQTRISFNLTNTESVSLNVYNSQGQHIETILNEMELTSGNHTYYWNGGSNSGEKLVDGVYYCILTTKNHTQSLKLILDN